MDQVCAVVKNEVAMSSLTDEIWNSARWAAILFIPTIFLTGIIYAMLGGIEGSGNALLPFVAAPVMLFERTGLYVDPFVVWPAIFIVEVIYFFLLIYLFRVLHLPAITRCLLTKIWPYLKAKAPPKY